MEVDALIMEGKSPNRGEASPQDAIVSDALTPGHNRICPKYPLNVPSIGGVIC